MCHPDKHTSQVCQQMLSPPLTHLLLPYPEYLVLVEFGVHVSLRSKCSALSLLYYNTIHEIQMEGRAEAQGL